MRETFRKELIQTGKYLENIGRFGNRTDKNYARHVSRENGGMV